MTDFADLSTRVLVTLGDVGGVKYDSDTLQESFRTVLGYFDRYYPSIATETLTLEDTNREVELDILVNPRSIINIVSPPDSPNHQSDYSPPYYVYFKGATPWVKFLGTYTPVIGNEFLITYSTSHTIDGLDDAEVTTVQYDLLELLIEGVAAYAKKIRAMDLIEEYGTRTPDVTKLFDRSSLDWNQFIANLSGLHSFQMTGFPKGFDI